MPLPRCFLSASGGLSRRALLRFRLRASDFLDRQKVTKDRLKDPWSLKISFPSNPAPCLPLNPALREPTRPAPACCRPWVGEKPAAPDDAAPCVGGHWGVGPCERRRGQAPALHVAVSPGRVRNRSRPLPVRRGRRTLHVVVLPGRVGCREYPPPGGHTGPPLRQIRTRPDSENS